MGLETILDVCPSELYKFKFDGTQNNQTSIAIPKGAIK